MDNTGRVVYYPQDQYTDTMSGGSGVLSTIPSTLIRWTEEARVLDGDSVHDCVTGKWWLCCQVVVICITVLPLRLTIAMTVIVEHYSFRCLRMVGGPADCRGFFWLREKILLR